MSKCATRPINTRLNAIDHNTPYSVERKDQDEQQAQILVVLAFSGGGMRAAAFSCGVLEALKRTESIRKISRAFNPTNWGALVSTGWGRRSTPSRVDQSCQRN